MTPTLNCWITEDESQDCDQAFVEIHLHVEANDMPTPEWDETQDVWMTRVDTNVFGRIEVMIKTDGEQTPPTQRQISTLELVAGLPAAFLDTIPSDARKYAEGFMMKDDFDELALLLSDRRVGNRRGAWHRLPVQES